MTPSSITVDAFATLYLVTIIPSSGIPGRLHLSNGVPSPSAAGALDRAVLENPPNSRPSPRSGAANMARNARPLLCAHHTGQYGRRGAGAVGCEAEEAGCEEHVRRAAEGGDRVGGGDCEGRGGSGGVGQAELGDEGEGGT